MRSTQFAHPEFRSCQNSSVQCSGVGGKFASVALEATVRGNNAIFLRFSWKCTENSLLFTQHCYSRKINSVQFSKAEFSGGITAWITAWITAFCYRSVIFNRMQEFTQLFMQAPPARIKRVLISVGLHSTYNIEQNIKE